MSEKEEFSKLTSIKECPICHGEIHKGYINPPKDMHWDTQKRKFYGRMSVGESFPALRCKQCEIVIFDWEEYVRQQTPKGFLKTCIGCGREIPIAELKCKYCGYEQEPKHKEDEQVKSRRKPRQARMIR